jgi:hypothetical protein
MDMRRKANRKMNIGNNRFLYRRLAEPVEKIWYKNADLYVGIASVILALLALFQQQKIEGFETLLKQSQQQISKLTVLNSKMTDIVSELNLQGKELAEQTTGIGENLELAKAQSRRLIASDSVENQLYFNRLKKTVREIAFIVPKSGEMKFESFEFYDQVEFLQKLKPFLESETDNKYILSDQKILQKWFDMFGRTQALLQVRMSTPTYIKNDLEYVIGTEELKVDFDKRGFAEYTGYFLEFFVFMTNRTQKIERSW